MSEALLSQAPRLRNSPDDLTALVGLAAAQRGLNPSFVEKDFWVCEVLRAACVPRFVQEREPSAEDQPVEMIFKGGTSLSKAFGLIERFSEDVDLLVRFPNVDVSARVRDQFLKRVCTDVGTHLGLEDAACQRVTSTTGVKRDVRYVYRRSFVDDLLTDGVLLEMGSRGGPHPASRQTFRSMVAEHAIDALGEDESTWEEFAPIEVSVLAPERTLLEKLALLHDVASRFDPRAPAQMVRAGRHLYDVHQLLSSPVVRGALADLGAQGRIALCQDIDDRSEAAGFSFTSRPAGGFAQSVMFESQASCRRDAERGFERALSLVYGDRPSFDTCTATVRTYADLL